jgi:ABC-type antimicrobial peptide transport system permease subunit
VAHTVGMRTREIGVRMSLGATGADVRRMIVRQGLGLSGIGIGLGLLVALTITRLFSSQLAGVSPYDPTSFALTVVLLVATTALACYLPARRAARLDPMRALRTE